MTDETPDASNDETLEPTQEELQALLDRLRTEHRRIDDEIRALSENGVSDMLKLRRMKKIKLSMKDQIVYLENQITPDIIA
ncbi:YdcH family protein [Litorimonas haliclonae]|uniref:YdcH family protein n=1 Tax=Litorimonas haliclonae TaxID=2081977 RepID=UPI0039F0B4E1